MEPQSHRNHPFGSLSSELLQPWNPRTWTNKWCRNCRVYNKWCRHELHRLYIKYDCYMNILYIHEIFHYAIHASLWVTVYMNENIWVATFATFSLLRYHSFMFEALMKWVLVLASMPTARGVVGEMPLVYWIGCQSYPLCQTRWTLVVLLRSKHCFKTSMVLDFEHILQVV